MNIVLTDSLKAKCRSIFERSPKATELHITSDHQAFYNLNDAIGQARNLVFAKAGTSEVLTVTRADVAEDGEQVQGAGGEQKPEVEQTAIEKAKQAHADALAKLEAAREVLAKEQATLGGLEAAKAAFTEKTHKNTVSANAAKIAKSQERIAEFEAAVSAAVNEADEAAGAVTDLEELDAE